TRTWADHERKTPHRLSVRGLSRSDRDRFDQFGVLGGVEPVPPMPGIESLTWSCGGAWMLTGAPQSVYLATILAWSMPSGSCWPDWLATSFMILPRSISICTGRLSALR